VVHWALVSGAAAIAAGERDPAKVRQLVADLISAQPLAQLDYAEVVDAATLQPVDPLAGQIRLLAATRFGRARLVDNEGATAAAPT
jgi:pantoate--beta-alanine ligase